MFPKNSLFSYIYHRTDFIVRLFYTQTPLGPLAVKIFSKSLYESNPKTLNLVFKYAYSVWSKKGLSIKNKIVLEIGPGTNLITALNFLVSGAKKIFLLDKYPRFNNPNKLIPTKTELSYFHKSKIKKFMLDSNLLNHKFVSFNQTDLNKYNQRVDVIFTKSVLEHIKDPNDFIKNTHRLLNTKGFAYHWIDLRDHYNFEKPFLFYKYPTWLWEKFLTKPGRSYTNRLRYHQFISLFKNSGFKIIWKRTQKSKITADVKLCSDFQDMAIDSLETTILEIIVQKT